jgi:hypothetical protein
MMIGCFSLFAFHSVIFFIEDEMGGLCSTNGGETERVSITGGKETTRNTKTQVGG